MIWKKGDKDRERGRMGGGGKKEHKRDEVRRKADIKSNQWGMGNQGVEDSTIQIAVYVFQIKHFALS